MTTVAITYLEVMTKELQSMMKFPILARFQ